MLRFCPKNQNSANWQLLSVYAERGLGATRGGQSALSGLCRQPLIARDDLGARQGAYIKVQMGTRVDVGLVEFGVGVIVYVVASAGVAGLAVGRLGVFAVRW